MCFLSTSKVTPESLALGAQNAKARCPVQSGSPAGDGLHKAIVRPLNMKAKPKAGLIV